MIKLQKQLELFLWIAVTPFNNDLIDVCKRDCVITHAAGKSCM